ncbi:mTERF [Mactra antiquata]
MVIQIYMRMFHHSLKCYSLHQSSFTYSTAQVLIQQLKCIHQSSSSSEGTRKDARVVNLESKKPLKLWSKTCKRFQYHVQTRKLSTGRLVQRKDKVRKNINVAKYLDDFDLDDLEGLEETTELIPIDKDQQTLELQKRRKEKDDLALASPKYYKPKSIIESIMEEDKKNSENIDTVEVSDQDKMILAETGELVISDVTKVDIPPIFSLDSIVNDSKVLQDLVKIGVDLTSLQKKGMIETVMRMNSKKEMAPYIFFLRDCGVPNESIGRLITRCPWIFQHSLHNLRVRVDYLRSKKFNIDDLSNMLERDPKFLLIPVEVMDARLGYIQKTFNLTGVQIRQKVSSYSKLIIAPSVCLQHSMILFKKQLEFTPEELKTMFLIYPKVFHTDKEEIIRNFDYVHNVMEISHDLIAKYPSILRGGLRRIESRHRFLLKCGRAQYDNTQENYISLETFITKRDEDWCFEVAKASLAEYNNFLKMI